MEGVREDVDNELSMKLVIRKAVWWGKCHKHWCGGKAGLESGHC